MNSAAVEIDDGLLDDMVEEETAEDDEVEDIEPNGFEDDGMRSGGGLATETGGVFLRLTAYGAGE